MKIVKSVQVFKHYLYLLQQLVSRDFKVKYKRSVLGVAWSVLNPLFTMIILNLVFSQLFNMKNYSDIKDFPIYLLTGLVLFNYFAEATNLSLGAVVTNFNLLTKVYIPKYIFPLSKILSSALNLLFSLVALYFIFAIEVLRGKPVSFSFVHLFLMYDLVTFVIFTIGIGLILSSLTVFFRDMFYIWGVALTAWNYLTPIVYPIQIVEKSKAWYKPYMMLVYHINPLYYYVNYARDVVLNNTIPSLNLHLACILFALFFLFIGVLLFRSKQDKFVYYI
ncbi:MAG TPA: ABC transporter permease [Ruminiclostridium sp.]|nr:ABC transporter permease [Ruminiclostridium sp.]